MDTYETPSKRLRIDESKATSLDDEWEDDDCFTDNLEQIDALTSHAYSQTSAGSSTSNNVNVGSLDASRMTGAGMIRPWTTSSSLGTSNQSASLQQQNYERQNQEMMNVQRGIKSTEEQLRSMSVCLAKNEQELEVTRGEKAKLEQKVAALEQERTFSKKQLEKMQKELDFMNHERSKRQWPSSLICVDPCKEPQPAQKQQRSTVSRRKDEPLNTFPTIQSFTQGTNFAKSPTNVAKVDEGSRFEKGETEIGRKNRKKQTMGTGPELVSLLLRETVADSFSSKHNPLTEWEKRIFPLGSHELEAESLGSSRRPCHNESPSRKSSSIVSNASVDLLSALIEMLQGDKNDDDDELECRLKWIPSDMSFLSSRLGLRNDSTHILLPAIEDILGALPFHNATTSNGNQGSGSLCPNAGHVLPIEMGTAYSGTTITSFQSLSSAESRAQASMALVTNALKLLRMIAYYSSKVRYFVIRETLVDAVDYCDFGVNNEPTIQCGSVNLLNGGGSTSTDNERVENGTKCLILSKLITFCCQDSQMDDSDASLFTIILDIFTAVCSYSSIECLSRFNPLLSSLPMEKFVNLTLNGSVFVQLLAFLIALAASPSVMENYCIRDEFCLWILLSNSWQKARKTLSPKVTEKIDLQMIVLLTTCLTHEEHRPSFLVSNDCHCPFEIATSVILYLHGQKLLYEQHGSMQSLSTMRKGISLLYLLTQADKNFSEHISNADAEYLTFIYWLPRVQKQLILGDESLALMEMWNIPSIDE